MPLIAIHCPYCGEAVDIEADAGDEGQQLIQDCEVCCRPIEAIVMLADDGEPWLSVRTQDDA